MPTNSRQSSAPGRRGWCCCLVFAVLPLAWFINLADAALIDQLSYKLGQLVAIHLLVYLAVRFALPGVYAPRRAASEAARARWASDYENWSRSWVCMDCGHVQQGG